MPTNNENQKIKYEYITGTDNQYVIDKDLVKKQLKDISECTSFDENINKVYEELKKTYNTFIEYIDKVQTKINQKSNIKSNTVNNLRNYITRFQQMKAVTKAKFNETKQQITDLSKKIDEGHKTHKNNQNITNKNLSKSKIVEEIVNFEKQYSEYKKQLANAQKSLPILEKQLDSTKNISRNIKFEALSSFGETSVKTLNNCIINFIRTFNSQIKAWNVVLNKKSEQQYNVLKKVFTLNSFRLKNIKTNLTSAKNKADVGYWLNKWKMFVDTENILETQSQNLDLTEYDKFLDANIEKLLSKLSDITQKIQNTDNFSNLNVDNLVMPFLHEIQCFRKNLFDYLYDNKSINFSSQIKEALFKLGTIRCCTEMYTNEVENKDFKNLKYVASVRSSKDINLKEAAGITLGGGISAGAIPGAITVAFALVLDLGSNLLEVALCSLCGAVATSAFIATPIGAIVAAAMLVLGGTMGIGMFIGAVAYKSYQNKIFKNCEFGSNNKFGLNKEELKQIKKLDKNKEKQRKLEQDNKHKVQSKIFNSKKVEI